MTTQKTTTRTRKKAVASKGDTVTEKSVNKEVAASQESDQKAVPAAQEKARNEVPVKLFSSRRVWPD